MKHLISIITFFSLLGSILYFVFLKYNNVSDLGISFYIASILSVISFVLVSIIGVIYFTYKKKKTHKGYIKYINYLFYFIGVVTLISSGFFIATISSDNFKDAKEKYNYNIALNSKELNVLNKELNRRWEHAQNLYEEANHRSSLKNFIFEEDKFVEVLKIQSEKNNGVAQGILGEYYFFGLDINPMDSTVESYEREKERAFYWWKKASENNDSRGLYRMGNCYAKIINIDYVPKDLNKAYQYWIAASNKGYGMAFKRIGDLFAWSYFDAIVVEKLNENEFKILGQDVYRIYRGDTIYSEPYPMPKEWKNDINTARKYWQKAVDCGGIAAKQAEECIEKVYPSEIK